MEDIRTRPLSAIDGPAALQKALPQVLLLIYILAALLAYLAAPFLAQRWMNAPYLGAFVAPGMVFSQAVPTTLGQQSQLLAVDGKAAPDAMALLGALEQHQPGDSVTLRVRGLWDGAEQHITVRLAEFAMADRLAYFYFPYLVGLIYLVAGVWVFAIRREHASARAFAFFAVSMALVIGLLFDIRTTQALAGLWLLAAGLTGGSAVGVALFFPREDALTRRQPLFTLAVTLAGLAVAVFCITRLGRPDAPAALQVGLALLWGCIALGLVFILAWSLVRRQRMSWPNDREQMRLLSIAALVSFGPFGAWWLARALSGALPFSPVLLIFLAIFPIMTGYTVQRYRVIQSDVVLSIGLRYGLLSVLVAAGYALIAAGLGLGVVGFIAPGNPAITGLIFFFLALALNPLRESAQRMVDHAFFRGKRAYQDQLQTFSGELTRVVDLPSILRILRRNVDEALAPTRLHIFIYDPLSDQYAAAADEDQRPTSDLRFPIISGLVIRLGEHRAPLLLSEYNSLPAALEPDRARLALLDAQAFVPLPGRQRLSGWLALGPRLSGEPYTSMQLGFAEGLCDQAALAIERAQVVANMENRVREMNVLNRVAQGINITLRLDDILELVYAQTTQILPAQYFNIMLYDKDFDVYQYPFFLSGDDRHAERENRPVPPGQALEQEVIRQRRAVRCDDYNRECQRRGVMVPRSDIVAWMGVPLNAGAETIGALSLASSDPAMEYTAEQQALLQAIADQMAGALVKARLLQETERRARQLSTLNDVTRQLTSTLETEPLLQSILQSAVDILNCEAGSLLLVDDTTDELVFRSVVGPVANNLMHRRMPSDKGVVGKSVKTGAPIIVNDVSRFPEWFPDADKNTGFFTRAVLVIPLMIKERVFGVIEVINKHDGTIFSRDDQDLLSAFASQAAVAIENARLYTNTDQALAARVEELSVMQRIDRELNASLDTTRAMRITLDWAMRQSGAQAGLVGVIAVEEGEASGGVRVMASQGYTAELVSFQNLPLPTVDYHLQEVIDGGLPLRRIIASPSDTFPVSENTVIPRALLAGGQSQAIIPIRRETNTIGLLLLESASAQNLSDEAMSFLVRLSDHASIAISNAQLYNEVQQANLAKSDFVSFVAHELKNPMTSVKGYTELISAGAVGPVNEAQSNFLGTIRSNIDRMNTLVSDLNDMSKIEVGRLRLDFKSLRLADSVESVVRSTRKQIEEKQQVLALRLPDDLPLMWADRVRLEQVLVNLVSNAHKYTPASGTLEVAAEHCKNIWDPNGAVEVVHIWVKDDGIGIAEEDQKKIFQKFFRSDDPKTREVPGTGLGLNITRSLVEMQGGCIWFESEFRKGATFHFTVPVSENPAG